jgi:U3 small nucleolar ribonucleoprotein component
MSKEKKYLNHLHKMISEQESPERIYLNDFHRKSSEASQKEVASMRKRPLSREEVLKQEKRRTTETTGRRTI